jgi:hypothetical protein
LKSITTKLNKMARQITISDLKAKVDEGWKKQALADHYGLPMTQMTKLLQEAGLKIRKFHAPLYVLVDDTVVGEAIENPAIVEEEATMMEACVTHEVEEAQEEAQQEPAMETASQTW